MTDVVMLIFWFKGLNSKAPFLTIDTRDHYISGGDYQQMTTSAKPLEMIINKQAAISRVNFESKSNFLKFNFSNVSNEAMFQTNGVTDSFLERTTYRIDYQQQLAYLFIERILAEDEGIYRCRVDFRHSRTINWFIHVELIIPPTKVFISDHNHTLITDGGLAGPYLEGQYIELICETKQAKPLPQVLWYEGSTLIDDSYELVSDSDSRHNNVSTESSDMNTFNYLYKTLVRARNRLKLIQPLIRQDLFRQFRCIAMNSEMIEPVASMVQIDLILPPINVEIVLDTKEAFHKGQDAQILCRSYGSRPVAQIHWYRNGQRILSRIEDYYDIEQNVSRSIMNFVPDENDDGIEIVCQSINIRLDQNQAVQDQHRITVHYMPIIQLSLYETNEQNLLAENSSIRLWCRINANPFPNKSAIWFFNSTRITESNDRFTILDNNQLLIDCLRSEYHDGYYYCLAENSQGRNRSNDFLLQVSYVPRCRNSETSISVAINQTKAIVCEVDARPSLVYFNWHHHNNNNNGTSITVNRLKYTTRGSTQSILMFTPRDHYDYGQLSCVAQNSVGKTVKPCIYTIRPYGPPEPIYKCIVDIFDTRYLSSSSSSSSSSSQLYNDGDDDDEKLAQSPLIKCQYNYNSGVDGGSGIDIYCQLEIYRSIDNILIWNMTNNVEQIDSCVFDFPISWLMANISDHGENRIQINVRTFNQQGSSKPYVFHTHLPIAPSSSSSSPPSSIFTTSQSSNSLIPLILNHISDLNDTSSMNDDDDDANKLVPFVWDLSNIQHKGQKLFKLLTDNGNWIFAFVFLLLAILMGFLVRTVKPLYRPKKKTLSLSSSSGLVIVNYEHVMTLKTLDLDVLLGGQLNDTQQQQQQQQTPFTSFDKKTIK
ncbi:hypothetical protein HUG17_0609 [Dermatophagoides farinae]|uniref:Ig-like domain-containing protein n=1 Tax=Dermatophagoides farinae TaxID=6954 RepID=A0A9D4P5B2_DERFA|nr:hypothetical protein HUG17_0609 [Dermatophagoides farinae]